MNRWKGAVKTTIAVLLTGTITITASKAQGVREVDVIVRDSYTLKSLEGVVVNALQGKEIAGTGVTDSTGRAYLDFLMNPKERLMLSNAYPNPSESNAKFDFVVGKPGLNRVELYNVLGQRVFSQEEHLSEGSYTLDFQGLERLSSGSYFLVLTNSTGRKAERFIVSGSNNSSSGLPSLSTSFNAVLLGFEHDTYFVLAKPGYERKNVQKNPGSRLNFLMDKQNEVFLDGDTLDVRITGGRVDKSVTIPKKIVVSSGNYTLRYDSSSEVAEVKNDTTLHIGRKE